MKALAFSLSFIVLLSCSQNSDKINNIEISSFNDGWEFALKDLNYTQIQIPHTPRIEPLVVNNQWQGLHFYKKSFKITNPSIGKYFLHFEGVMHDAKVFINSNKVTTHLGGYLPFTIDLSNYLFEGENTINVEVSNLHNPTIPPGKELKSLDFNFYGGIYRDVWLIRKNKIYVTDPFVEKNSNAGWLLYFDKVSKDIATGTLRIELKNELKADTEVEVQGTLSTNQNEFYFNKKINLEKNTKKILSIPIEIDSPQLWSTTRPTLYDLTIDVISNGLIYDKVKDKVGIRDILLTEDGFFLNGKKLFIRGTNRHQEYPYVGYAISNNANFRDALKIKNAGFDFVRLSHYPQDKSFLDACDELGLMVMNAIPGWQYFEDGQFMENSYQDIRDMIRRDRNHPSVVFWEVSLNESEMTEEFIKKSQCYFERGVTL